MSTKEIVKFDITDSAIKKMEREFKPLKIKDLKDKDGLQAVKSARKTVRDHRIAVENRRKELVADSVAYQKMVNGEATRIKELLIPIEDHLKSEEDRIEELKEEQRRKAEEEKQKRIQGRVSQLLGVGFTFNGFEYTLGELTASLLMVSTLSEENFDELLKKAKVIQEEEAEKRRVEEEKKKAEEARLKKQQEEQEREKKRLAEEAEKLRLQQEEIAKEKQKIEDEKAAAKAEAERKKNEERLAKEAAERAKVEAEERAKREAAEKAEAERLEAERLEEERRSAPDKEKFNQLVKTIVAIEVPEFSSKKGIKKAERVKTMLKEIINYITE